MDNTIKTAMNCVDKYHLSRKEGLSKEDSLEQCEMFLSGRVKALIISHEDAVTIMLHLETIAMFDK
jgi:hypothetical protein